MLKFFVQEARSLPVDVAPLLVFAFARGAETGGLTRGFVSLVGMGAA